MSTGRLVVAITGASGSLYAQRFLARAVDAYEDIYLMLSPQATQVAECETGFRLERTVESVREWIGEAAPNLHLCDDRDYFTPPASGSFRTDGMVIMPCSMGTIGRIANGISDNLISRAADVCLKERRKLIVVPREMPWNLVMLKNATALTEAGGIILPASPAWYYNPQTLEDLADTVVDRVCQLLGIQHMGKEWMSE